MLQGDTCAQHFPEKSNNLTYLYISVLQPLIHKVRLMSDVRVFWQSEKKGLAVTTFEINFGALY